MVGRFLAKPKPGRIKENADGEVIFRGSEGLWGTLVAVAALVGVLAIWVAVSTIASGRGGESVAPFLVGVGVCLFLLLGAWFARTQRREVVVDAEGLRVRTRDGQVKQRVTWAEVSRIESRFLPSHPTQPGVVVHCVDGSSHFIDPLQVYDTSTLVYEAQRRKKLADDAIRLENIQRSGREQGEKAGG
jgi:hypothetical protein